MEPLLDFRAFRDVYGDLALRILHISEDILICLPLKQIVTHLPEAIVAAVVQWRPLSEILSIYESSMG